jgi:hypothetical protein
MLGSNPAQLRLLHWLSDALTIRPDLIYTRLDLGDQKTEIAILKLALKGKNASKEKLDLNPDSTLSFVNTATEIICIFEVLIMCKFFCWQAWAAYFMRHTQQQSGDRCPGTHS